MLFVKVINGIVVQGPATLPRTLETDTGTVVNFDKLDTALLKDLGYIPYTDTTGAYDQATHDVGDFTYNIGASAVTGSRALTERSISTITAAKITEVYARCKGILDSHSAEYSAAEISSFSTMQTEVKEYAASGTVGPAMQVAIDRGRHTASTLEVAILPKALAQDTALLARDMHLAAIEAITDLAAMAHYDTSAGW